MSTEELTRQRIAAHLRRPVDELDDRAELLDLVADSLDLVELAIGLQEDLGVSLAGSDLDRVRTVDDLISLIAQRHARHP